MRRARLPVICAVLQVLAVASGSTSTPGPSYGLLFAALGLASGAVLAWRGRFHGWVLGFCALAYPAQAMLLAPPVPAAMTVLAYELARRPSDDRGPGPDNKASATPWWRRVVGFGAALVVGAVGLAASGQPYWVAPYALALVIAYAAGLMVSAREARQEALSRALLDEQRMQIARELHDVVGHSASAICAQSGAARVALTAGAVGDATAALLDIETASRALLREARWMVGLLRDVGDLPGLAELDNLLDNARRSGLDLRVVRAGSVEGVSAEASHAAYRIVQEALTNVLRHGADGPVEISLRVAENLVIRVHNSCPASTAHGPDGVAATDALPGNGIRGMQERASAVGGTVRVGPGRAMGWSVEADLPVGAGP